MKLLMQCPGCWSVMESEPPKPNQYFECSGCGERLTVIDLRDGGDAPLNVDRSSLTLAAQPSSRDEEVREPFVQAVREEVERLREEAGWEKSAAGRHRARGKLTLEAIAATRARSLTEAADRLERLLPQPETTSGGER